MAEKRRTSTRGKIEGPPRKKIHAVVRESASTDPGQKTEQPLEPIPNKIIESKSLPTTTKVSLLKTQPSQSISESGVLAASLIRSRNVCLSEGLLERYWTKPTKKKGHVEIANNPPKESMQKIGPCRLTIEPLVYDATLYSIRTWPPPSASTPLVPKVPPQGQVPTFGSPSAFNTSPVGTQTAMQKPPVLAPAPFTFAQPPVISQQSPAAGSVPTFTSQYASPAPSLPMTATTNTTSATSAPLNTGPAALTGPPAIPQAKPSQDPVIQMLAQRASTNPELKVLMKIVASGNATGEQLRVFQNHIDDLTAILQRQKQMSSMAPPPIGSYNTPFMRGGPSLSAQFSGIRPLSHMSNTPPNYHHQTPVKPKAPPQPKFDITGVAIEFSGSTDRFLFPKHSVLEFALNGRQLVASFLVVRKGSIKESEKYDANREYYQPVTMRLNTEYPRVFECVSKTVAPYEDVIKHMEEVMNRATRAQDAQLVLQLAQVGEATDIEPGAAASIPDAISVPKASRQKGEDHCQYCFSPVPVAQVAYDEETLCEECIALMGVRVLHLTRENGLAYSSKQCSGVQTLVLYPEAR